ncbi:MAG TPA: DNA polymerase III subunit alpha [Mucilaginibacter sp.]|nr:DNA polymerase III subunit alpha [Mucilaginibacter sp.]
MYLNCKTYYSFKYGSFSTEELVKTAVDKGIKTLTLTNINTTYDTWDFVKHCRASGIKPITGAEIRNGDELLYILIAANNRGLADIHQFLSAHLTAKTDFPASTRVFTNSYDGYMIYPLGKKELKDLLPNERIGIKPSEINKLFSIEWKGYEDKFVIRQPVTIQNKDAFYGHCLLRAIDKNIVLSKLTAEQCCGRDETFLSPSDLLKKFSDYSFIVTNTLQLMEACNIEMDFGVDKTKKVYGGSLKDDCILLEKLATAGLHRRYGKKDKVAAARMRKELDIIFTMGFTSYFMINHDLVQYANTQGYYHVGRGSGANSIVAFCLGITDVDPIELNLYFERFLNPERTSPPDFDIDFSYTDRDDVMDYLFKRYGTERVALLGSVPTFQWDGVIRQLGKVYGLPDEEIKVLQRSSSARDEVGQKILKYGKMLLGFPIYPSVHPCGVLITEEPIINYATVFMPPKGLATVHIDMFTAEDIGINKFDILSQRGLGHIKETLALVKKNKGIDIDIHNTRLFRSDEKVKAQIRNANTIGCFYIESPAMRQLLKKLKCDDYATLVAASSIIRPGVASSGMMREYIYRYHNRSAIKYLHPLFEEHLSETFGVMVFQEDVIKIAHYYAGLTLGEADVLRRAMSGKYRSNNEFKMIELKFYASAKKLGRDEKLSAEVWRQMVSFAGYSFNKAHSASFAVESYMSLYLKTYFPQEFMVAVINNFGGFYSRELYFLELLKEKGDIEPPCINNSDLYTNIVGSKVHAGFIHIKRLQDKLIEQVLDERKINGPFLHLQDFIERIHPPLEQLTTLVSIGAFRFTGKSKKTLLWEANFLQKKNKDHYALAPPLFKEKPHNFQLPELADHAIDDLYDHMEILGFPLTNPFSLADADPNLFVSSNDMPAHRGKTISVLAYFIDRKHVTTKKNTEMFFGTFIDSELNWIDTVHFPDVVAKYPLHDAGFYKICGKVVTEFGVDSLEVRHMEKIGHKHRSYAGL